MPGNPELAYGKIASFYNAFLTVSGFKKGIGRFLKRSGLDLPHRPTILDAGCGTGLISCFFARRFPRARIYATDIDAKMLSEMERILRKEGLSRRNIVIAESNLKSPERIVPLGQCEAAYLPGNFFDVIVASGALEHVPLTESVAKLSRLLKSSGTFLNLALRRSPIGATLGMMYGVQPYKIADMRRAFERAGLENIRVVKLSVDEFPANLSRVAIIARKPR